MICRSCSANINDASPVCPCCLEALPAHYVYGGITVYEPVPDPRNARIERLQAECLAWRGHFKYGTRLELGVKPACKDVDDNHDLA